MWIFERAREILLFPAKTWESIKEEKDKKRLIVYPLVLALIQPVAIILGYGTIGLWIGPKYVYLSLINAFYSALVAYFLSLMGIFVFGFLMLVLANYFSAEGDIFSAMKLAVYSSTAPLAAGIFQAMPGINMMMVLGLYGSYLLYLGIPKIMKAPHDKESPFVFSAIIAGITIILLINSLISHYILGILYSNFTI